MSSQAKKPTSGQDTYDFIIQQIERMETDPDRHVSILIDNALREAVTAAMANGKKNTVTIKIGIVPSSDYRVARDVGFTCAVKADIARAPIQAVRVFADRETGELSVADPNQGKLPLAVVRPPENQN